jgi:formyltetrahydrofolate hydrolase
LVSQEGHCLSDLARVVLAAAVRAHVEDRILVSKNKTVVFD